MFFYGGCREPVGDCGVVQSQNAVTAHSLSEQLLLFALHDNGVVVSTAAFHARVRGSVPGLGGLKRNTNVSSPSTCES